MLTWLIQRNAETWRQFVSGRNKKTFKSDIVCNLNKPQILQADSNRRLSWFHWQVIHVVDASYCVYSCWCHDCWRWQFQIQLWPPQLSVVILSGMRSNLISTSFFYLCISPLMIADVVNIHPAYQTGTSPRSFTFEIWWEETAETSPWFLSFFKHCFLIHLTRGKGSTFTWALRWDEIMQENRWWN